MNQTQSNLFLAIVLIVLGVLGIIGHRQAMNAIDRNTEGVTELRVLFARSASSALAPAAAPSITNTAEGGSATVYSAGGARQPWNPEVTHTTREVAEYFDHRYNLDTIRRWIPLYEKDGVAIEQDEKSGRYTFPEQFTPYVPE